MKLSTLVSCALGIFAVAESAAVDTALAKRDGRTSPPSGCLVVRGSGTQSGEYPTFKAAHTALGSATVARCIFIYSGTYKEAIYVNYKGALTIYGYTTK